MKKRLLLLLSCSLFFAGASLAQSQLTGRVYEDKTSIFIPGVKVEDLKSHAMTMTGPDGSFSINARVGDLVLFTNSNYKPDTVYITEIKYMQIFLALNSNMLKEVKITNQQIRGNAGFTTQEEKGLLGSKHILYQADSIGRYKGGIKIPIFDAPNTKRRHEERVAESEKQKAEIEKVFSPENLKKYLPITGQEMQNFIILYMPDVATYFGDGFSLTTYLSDSYKDFMKIPPDERRSKKLTQLTDK